MITIVTPVYNREIIVSDTILSLINQTCKNWEYLLVDDCSTDNTWGTIAAFANNDKRIIALRRNRLPKGAQACRNMGIKKANGKYIIFLDSDDILLPFCIEQRTAFIAKIKKFDCAIFPKKEIRKREKDDILLSYLKYRLPLQTTDMLWNAEFLSNIGGFNEKLTRFQDVELTIRAFLEKGMKYTCSSDHSPDSIYYPCEGNAYGSQDELTFKGLLSFIDEVLFLLKKKRKLHYRRHLKNYLCSWLIHYHGPETKEKSIELIRFFHSHGIISGVLNKACSLSVQLSKYGILEHKLYSKILFYSLFKMN